VVRQLLAQGFYSQPLVVHGVDLRIHLEHLLNTPLGLKHAPPRIKIFRRTRRMGTLGTAWWHHNRINLNEMPGYDGFDSIDTLVHELAHLLVPQRCGHDSTWERVYKTLAFEVYNADIEVHRFHSSKKEKRLHHILRTRNEKGLLTLP